MEYKARMPKVSLGVEQIRQVQETGVDEVKLLRSENLRQPIPHRRPSRDFENSDALRESSGVDAALVLVRQGEVGGLRVRQVEAEFEFRPAVLERDVRLSVKTAI